MEDERDEPSSRDRTPAERKADKAAGDKYKLDIQIATLLIDRVPPASIAKKLGVSVQRIDAVAEMLG
jgi:hypothetical protein